MRVDSLDGLRAILALWVVFAHLGPYVGVPIPQAANPAAAVDFFMVLSGFLIASTYERLTETEGGWRAISFFWIRRVMRIWPLYVFLLTAVWIFAAPLYEYTTTAAAALQSRGAPSGAASPSPGNFDFPWVKALWHYSLLFGLNQFQATSTPLPDWSLSLEFQFYLVFPLVAISYKRWPLATCFLAAVLAYLSPRFFGNYLEPGRFAHFHQPALLTYRLNLFLVGCIAYYLFKKNSLDKYEIKNHQTDLVALLLCMSVVGVRSAFGVIFIIYLLAHQNGGVGKFLSTKVMTWMGRISFSIYLVHLPLLKIVIGTLAKQFWYLSLSPNLRYAAAAGILIPIVLATSQVLYKLIEIPCNKIAHRWTSRKEFINNSDVQVSVNMVKAIPQS